MNKRINERFNNASYRVERMSNDIYTLRRKVINIIYQLKNDGCQLPRIEVRILTDKADIMGVAFMGKNIIGVTAETTNDKNLYTTVMHELLHAIKATNHINNCPIMHPTSKFDGKYSYEELLPIFKKYLNN